MGRARRKGERRHKVDLARRSIEDRCGSSIEGDGDASEVPGNVAIRIELSWERLVRTNASAENRQDFARCGGGVIAESRAGNTRDRAGLRDRFGHGRESRKSDISRLGDDELGGGSQPRVGRIQITGVAEGAGGRIEAADVSGERSFGATGETGARGAGSG